MKQEMVKLHDGESIKDTTLDEIMSTTKMGELVVLVEVEKNTYIRKKNGLQRIRSQSLKIERIN